ncbi:unnamed protein product [Anisakis simplex]|uniref:Uncharacterized protein n=1 Tax=Anisakis simplex TaxID=6269 RepID=A0A0M3JL56_ANISI|nr:unnamed protein product [Anisakis simplex]
MSGCCSNANCVHEVMPNNGVITGAAAVTSRPDCMPAMSPTDKQLFVDTNLANEEVCIRVDKQPLMAGGAPCVMTANARDAPRSFPNVSIADHTFLIHTMSCFEF